MKKTLNFALLAAGTLTLAACSSCPDIAGYDKVPYTGPRTAGTGISVYDNDCVAPVSPQVDVDPAPVPVAREPVQSAEPVFIEKQRK